jgi:alkylated DNA repair dioxygenase AlkB
MVVERVFAYTGGMGIDAPLPLSLFATGAPSLDAGAAFRRDQLDDRCWVDVAAGWVHGGDELLAELADALPWTQSRRLMWGNWVDEPRLTAAAALDGARTPPLLREITAALSARYAAEFHSCFCNFYRGGNDSVAWHSDRNGRTEADPYVAIVSLGGPRQFVMRPKDAELRRGTRARTWTLHSGDLLVMGGSCQHEWEHAVPKVHHAPPRMSVTFRHRPRAGQAAPPTG